MTGRSFLKVGAVAALIICLGYTVTSLFTEQPLIAEEAKDNVVEVKSIQFTDDQGATLATLTVRQTKVEGKPAPQLVLLDTHGNEVWTAPPEFRAIPLGR